jgi:hypothetical protein
VPGGSARPGESAEVSITTVTARLDDPSSSAVGANSSGEMFLITELDESSTANNQVACGAGDIPVTGAPVDHRHPIRPSPPDRLMCRSCSSLSHRPGLLH